MASVSIVIPCFNVEEFLDACIRSVVGQTLEDLQIVLVDDGSEDATPRIVDDWAERDERITVLHQANRGLGGARNAGARMATGSYLFFLDSDDLLPHDALSRMVQTAEATGSDMVSGVAERFNAENRWRAATYRSVFNHDRRRVHLFNEPDLLYDHIACSKLFRREFWDRHQFEFPEGVLFEDIALATKAHCLARAVDLESTPTYLWREREGIGGSITQERTKRGSTTARFAALSEVDAYLMEHAPRHVWDAHAAKVFSLDVPVYCRLAYRADSEYLRELVDAAGPLARSASRAGIERLRPLHQLTWQALCRGDLGAVAGCAALLESGATKSLRSLMQGRSLLPRDLRRTTAVRSQAQSVAGYQVRAGTKRIRRGVRTVASRSGGALVEVFHRRDSANADTRSSDEITRTLDASLSRTTRLEASSKQLARRLRVLPPPREPGPFVPAGRSSIELAGVILGRIEAPRDSGLLLRFDTTPLAITSVIALHERERLQIRVPFVDGAFVLDTREWTRFAQPATLRPPRWILVAVDANGDAWNAGAETPVSADYVDRTAGARYELRGGPLGLSYDVASLLPESDRTERAQRMIRTAYRTDAASRRSRTVLYECFYGRSVGCHPRALFEDLQLRLPDDVEHVFVTQPGFLHAPVGAATVQRWTRRYHELLATAPLVISNCELHPTFARAPFQTVVQTWHGTPLKRIGLDIERLHLRNQDYQSGLAHQSAQWSMMLSPTADTDEIFPRAFGYSGMILPIGSPRNDRIVDVDLSERRRIRSGLGLAHDEVAVLFAPTFRDNAHSDAGYVATPQCDLSAVLSALPDSTRVLFRAHSNIRSADVPWSDERVINVSDYQDAQDLIIAGDVLVTDYSSLMFDWALTDKPIVLYAPDLVSYRDTRDFYYDYESLLSERPATSPGELQSSLAKSIASADVDLSDLIARFSHRDDGTASRRATDVILQELDLPC
jgi:CDP-glycerol glycerophosphotransferase